MHSEIWLKKFFEVLDRRTEPSVNISDGEWTAFIQERIIELEDALNCQVLSRSRSDSKRSGEYLSLDAMFLNPHDIEPASDETPLYLPICVLEHEHGGPEYIKYSLWKLACVRSPLRVLICYRKNSNDIEDFVSELTNYAVRGGLLRGDAGETVVLIGDGSLNKKGIPWREYYSAFEWRADRFQEYEWGHGRD